METIVGYVLILLTMFSYMVGFLLPYIIRIVNKDIVNDDERLIMTYLICFIASMLLDFKSFESGDIVNLGMWFLLVSQEAQSSFKLYFKPKWESQAVADKTV